MKKHVVMTLAGLALLQAQELPYKVFVESFSSANNPALESTYNELLNALNGYDNLRVVKRPSGKYHVVVVETIMEKSKFKKLYKKIKSLPKHKDAFYLAAPELLAEQDGLRSNVSYAQAANVAQESVVQESTTQENFTQPQQQYELTETLQSSSEDTANEQMTVVDEDATQTSASTSAQSFTLDGIINGVLIDNPNIRKRIYDYIETGKDLDIAQRGYYPTLDLTASIGLDRTRVHVKDKKSKWEKGVNKNAELRLIQNIYNGGATANYKEQASSRMVNASYLVLQTADRTSLKTVDAYLNVIKEKTLLDLTSENVTNLEGIYGQIKERSDSGFGRKSEKQQAASRLTLAQTNFVAQQNAYDDALSTFQKLTGKMVGAEQLSYPEFSYTLPSDVKSLEDISMQCNPSIRAQQANILLAKNILKGSNAAFLPKLDLEAFANIKQVDNYVYDDQRTDSYGALLRLNYNLINKGIDMASKEKRQVAIQKEQEILDVLKDDLLESLKFSWQSYVLNDKKMGYIVNHAKFSKETLEAYKEEFNIGKRELINVLDAENEYFNARKEIVSAKKDLLYAKYRLLDNMGLLTESFKPGFGKKYIKNACSIKQ